MNDKLRTLATIANLQCLAARTVRRGAGDHYANSINNVSLQKIAQERVASKMVQSLSTAKGGEK